MSLFFQKSIYLSIIYEPVGGEGEGNLDGVRVGLGHRFAAAWVRVRAAFGDG